MKLKDMTITALFAALLCAIAPFTVNIGPIPLSLATFAVYLAGAVLGARRGTLAVLLYLLLGAVGLPVFSGFAGGFAKLAGVTGGYLAGYLPCAFLTGFFADKKRHIASYAAGMLLGTAALYALGTLWFCLTTKSGLGHALAVCVLPFLPGDGVKLALASVLGVELRPLAEKLA